MKTLTDQLAEALRAIAESDPQRSVPDNQYDAGWLAAHEKFCSYARAALAAYNAQQAQPAPRRSNPALAALRHHVTGAIERDEAVAIECVSPAYSVEGVEFDDYQRARYHARMQTMILGRNVKIMQKDAAGWHLLEMVRL